MSSSGWLTGGLASEDAGGLFGILPGELCFIHASSAIDLIQRPHARPQCWSRPMDRRTRVKGDKVDDLIWLFHYWMVISYLSPDWPAG